MRKTLIVLVTALVALAALTPAVVAAGPAASAIQEEPTCEYPLELEDATGEVITIDDEPDSVVALQPSDAQTLFEIGAEEKVVGAPVGQYTEYLDADEDLDITESDDATPVAEEVIDREPDVVLAGNTLQGHEVIDQLREAGLTVYVFPTGQSLEGVTENVRLTGEIVGECDGAAETLEWMDERLELVEETVEDEDRPLAYYAMGGGFTAGEGTFDNEILTTAGTQNLGAEAGIEGWAEISDEVILEEDPEWIVYGESMGEPPVSEAAMETTAYENEQFVAVADHQLNQPGPLVVHAIETIAQEIHPDAYESAEAALEDEGADADNETDDADDETDRTDDTADDETDDTADTEEDETGDEDESDDEDATGSNSIPGFGIPVTAAALLAVIGALSRRL